MQTLFFKVMCDYIIYILNDIKIVSAAGEDIFIQRNFINKFTIDGIFLELGACDGLRYSNTMFFEQYYGFK